MFLDPFPFSPVTCLLADANPLLKESQCLWDLQSFTAAALTQGSTGETKESESDVAMRLTVLLYSS